jgi:hypothetical protein
MTWRQLVESVIEDRYRRGQTVTLQNLYQAVKASPALLQMNRISDLEATIRRAVNDLTNAGVIERLGGRGDYRRPK